MANLYRYRSNVSGKFVSESYALRNPEKVERELVVLETIKEWFSELWFNVKMWFRNIRGK